jgi:hypothetical protein
MLGLEHGFAVVVALEVADGLARPSLRERPHETVPQPLGPMPVPNYRNTPHAIRLVRYQSTQPRVEDANVRCRAVGALDAATNAAKILLRLWSRNRLKS